MLTPYPLWSKIKSFQIHLILLAGILFISFQSSFANSTPAIEPSVENIDPIAICQDFSTVLDFSGTKAISPFNVNGGSFDPDGNIVDFSLDKDFFTCDDLGVNVVTLTVEDNDGNTATCTANVTISFPQQTLACFSQLNLSLGIDGTATLEPEDLLANPVFDPCNLITVSPSFFTCDDIGLHTVILEDGTGNSCWSTVLVEDKTPPSFIYPEDVTLQCGDSSDPSITGEPIIIDNCGQFGTSYNDQIFNLPGNNIKILREWTILDWLTGDVETYVQIIQTTDNTSPTAICISQVNVSLDQFGQAVILPEYIDGGSYDDCGDVSLEVSPSNFNCSNIGDTTIVFLTVTDESGNTNQCWTTVFVEDKLGPTAVCIAELYLSLSADGTGTIAPEEVDAGSFDNCGPVTLELSQTEFDCSDIGDSIVVILTVTDASGNTNNCWSQIVVEDKIAPVITCPDNITVDCSLGDNLDPEITGQPTATDNCDLLGFAFEDQILPLGGPNFKVLREWIVIDWYSGFTDTCLQVITVLDMTPPDLVCVGQLNVSLGFDGTTTIQAEDLDAGTTDDCGSVSLQLFQTEFDCDDIGENEVTLFAYDDTQNASECTVIVNVQDNQGPTAVCIAELYLSLSADGTGTIAPEEVDAGSYDNCGPVTLELSQTEFDCSDIGDSIVVILTVTDASGNTNNCWSQIVVEDKIAPVITCPDNITVDCALGDNLDPEITGQPTATDNCDLLGFAFEDQILPIGGPNFKVLREWVVIDWYSGFTDTCLQVITVLDMTPPDLVCVGQLNVSLGFDGTATIQAEDLDAGTTDDCGSVSLQLFQTEFDCDNIGENEVTLFAYDDSQNASECTVIVNVQDNQGPNAVCIAELYLSLSADGTGTIAPEEVDAGSFDNCGPVTLELNQTEFDCGDIGDSIVVILTVTDASGNTNNCWSQIVVEDKIAPVITCPDNITVDCALGDNLDPEITGQATATDNCEVLGFTYDDQILPLGGPNFKVLREWVVIDWYSGFTDTCYQVINVLDLTPPDIICLSRLTASLDASGNLTLFPEDFDAGTTDACGDFTLSISQSEFDCDDVGSNLIIVTAIDDNGNVSQCTTELIIVSPDNDNDGVSLCDGDCDDTNDEIYPGAPEICNDNIDNNCDGEIDENCICASYAASTQYEWIETISVNSTTNNSGNDNGYGDYSGIVIPVEIGLNPAILTPGFDGSSYNEYWSIWIDLNQNGVYENSELVLSENSSGIIDESFLIPPTANLGFTSMRISMQYAQPAGPCDIFDEGEVEDYTVEITEPFICASAGASTQYEWIKKVRLKSINNNSGNNNGYADFTYLSTNLNPGQSKNIKLKPGFSGSSYLEYWRVWVDWNEDGDFDDAGELEVQESSSGNITSQITVPTSASSGNKTMRVSMSYDGYPDPCAFYTYGEVEDYTIFVTGSNPLIDTTLDDDFFSANIQSLNDIENDGTTRDDELTSFNFTMYPNPAQQLLTIRMEGELEVERSITMKDAIGQTIYKTTRPESIQSIDLSGANYLNGVYFITIQNGMTYKTQKLIIAK